MSRSWMLAAAIFAAAMALAPAWPAAAKEPDPIAAKINETNESDAKPLTPQQIVEQANAAPFAGPWLRDQDDPRVVRLQVLLARNHSSPGVVDGRSGGNLNKAVSAFQAMAGLRVDGNVSDTLWSALEKDRADPVLVQYVIRAEDVAGPFVPDLPTDYAEMAKLKTLAYRDPAERLAETFHMDESFLKRLNPDAAFDKPGSTIVVADTRGSQPSKVKRVVADKARRQVFGYDEAGKLVVAYPATIGSTGLPSPTGTHAVKNVVMNPEYSYRPEVNFQQGDNDKPLRIPPGPNNPVGAVWIGLDKPTYGIHGTPEPSKIDKTNSHGCVRLTNWDAKELAGLVEKGVPVEFLENEDAADASVAK